jgi:hypothetical protein
MHRSRLLFVIPAVSALIFTGIAPAAADNGYKARVTGSITDIDRSVEARGDKVRADFEYKCWGTRKGNADVDLYQKRAHYDGDAWLKCDGKKHWVGVDLRRDSYQKVDNGKAWLEVKLQDGYRTLDHEKTGVWVRDVKHHSHY